ncbi:MAG: hypothetical protein JWO30_2623 [Fibrobacteres bacterium]|nr:hypothetical protein [Fibrobacterota bacterium]
MIPKAPGSPKAPALIRFPIFNLQFSICKIVFFLPFLLPLSSHAVHFPDTADLKKDYRVSARKDGRPADFFRKVDGDSATLHIEWTGRSITAARIEQGGEFDPDSFSVVTTEFGNGAAWHESMSSKDAQALKLYPGLQQEWILKGYGGEKGWLGSGVNKGRYFLVFRETPPTAVATVAGPLRLNRGVFAFLDSSSQWLHVPCRNEKDAALPDGKAKGKTAPVCFSPGDDSRFIVRIDRKKPLALQAWMEEGESGALKDIKSALKTVPDAAQAEYAQDLSQMLLGEAQMFLVKLSQRLPETFNWPSWQIQDFKGGRIPAADFLPIVRRQENPGDSLPAFRFEDSGLKLSVNLYYQGRFHLSAEENEKARKAP